MSRGKREAVITTKVGKIVALGVSGRYRVTEKNPNEDQ